MIKLRLPYDLAQTLHLKYSLNQTKRSYIKGTKTKSILNKIEAQACVQTEASKSRTL